MNAPDTSSPQPLVTDHSVELPYGRLHVNDHPGREPAFVLMHGFPDDSRIYNRLAGLLAPQRVLSFDFVGYGRSDRPDSGALDADHHEHELTAVLDTLGIEHAALVAHDASGPVAIDHALSDPSRVTHLILLNTYFGRAASVQFPEMIRLLADPDLTPLADAMLDDADQRLWLLQHTARRFGIDAFDPAGIGAVAVLPQFFGDAENPHALPAIRAWTAGLFSALDRQDAVIDAGRLRDLDMPVTLLFGAGDEYLSSDLARELAAHFRQPTVHFVEDATHWPQWDQPDVVARHLHEAVGVRRVAS
jgi:pimeloyl-ACP methyl ester carboxylesterase